MDLLAASTHLLLRHWGELGGRGPSGGHDGARQGNVGQPPLPHPAAVVGDLEGAAFVVVQSASCRWDSGFSLSPLLSIWQFYLIIFKNQQLFRKFWFQMYQTNSTHRRTLKVCENWKNEISCFKSNLFIQSMNALKCIMNLLLLCFN